MTFKEPENTHIEHPTVDSGIHVRDTEKAPASTWQIVMVGLLLLAILCVFFYGLTNQRTEVAGANQPHTNVAAPLGHASQTATTTGQAVAPTGGQHTPRAEIPQGRVHDQNARPPATDPGEANEQSR